MSSSACEVVSTTTGMRRSSGSALISASTSRPSLRGRFRSSRIRSGPRRLGVRAPAAAENSMRLDAVVDDAAGGCTTLASFRASMVSRTSPGLSSTSRISMAAIARTLASCVAPPFGNGEDRTSSPCPARDSTQIRPPWRSTIFLQIARPMPVPGYSLAAVQPLEDQEDPLDVLRLDADAVVAHAKNCHSSSVSLRRDVDLRRLVGRGT